MTVIVNAPVEDSDKMWRGLSDAWGTASPMICIPVDQLDGMGFLEIGVSVIKAVKYAHYAQALNNADMQIARPDHLVWLRDTLLPFKDWDDTIFKRLQEIESQLAQVEQSKIAKTSKNRKRGEISRNYNDIFVALGRRDSFQCAHCSATTDLEIDHVFPLAKNGGNELGNLQLLCSACNSRKGSNLECGQETRQ